MKRYVLAIAICFAVIDLSFAMFSFFSIGKDVQDACLHSNGMNDTDVDLLKELMRNDTKDQRAIDLEKKFTCAVSCVIDASISKKDVRISTYQLLTNIIEKEIPLPAGEQIKNELKNTLDTCHQQDEGDNCKLLKCVKILVPPFKDILIFV